VAFLSSQKSKILVTSDHYVDSPPAVHLWDVATRKELARLTMADPKWWWNNLVVSPDDQLLAAHMRGGTLVLWDLSALGALPSPSPRKTP
jgi:hypothetical protein